MPYSNNKERQMFFFKPILVHQVYQTFSSILALLYTTFNLSKIQSLRVTDLRFCRDPTIAAVHLRPNKEIPGMYFVCA